MESCELSLTTSQLAVKQIQLNSRPNSELTTPGTPVANLVKNEVKYNMIGNVFYGNRKLLISGNLKQNK